MSAHVYALTESLISILHLSLDHSSTLGQLILVPIYERAYTILSYYLDDIFLYEITLVPA